MIERAYLPIVVAVLVFSALSASGPVVGAAPHDDPFPEPDGIRGNVDFWIRVFAEWNTGQVAVHDLDHPALIYEVVELPGPSEGRYTEEQTKFVEALRERWEGHLYAIEQKLAKGQPLEEIEKKWVLHVSEVAGSGSLVRIHERVRTQRGLRERFRAGLERSSRYLDRIRRIFRDAGLPEDLAYLPHVESSFQYHAKSPVGATGLWQFTRSTGKRYLTINSAIDERLDPIAASDGAARYLRDAYEKLGTWPLAVTSYNHGVHGMLRAKKRFGSDFTRIYREYDGRTFGFASKNFYAEFLAARAIALDPLRYFPEGYQPEPPDDHDSVVLEHRATPARIARAFGIPLDELTALNPAWSRRAVQKGLALPADTVVWVPDGSEERVAELAVPHGWIDDDGFYVVQPGDTLSDIAQSFGIGLSTLRRLNGLSGGDSLIHVGDRLRLDAPGSAATHVVARGESLYEVARRHGTTVQALRRLNGMPAGSSLIRPGQSLRLPGDGAREREHVVRRGDTLLRIASAYGVRLAELLSANTLTVHSVIHPGQTLRIPGR